MEEKKNRSAWQQLINASKASRKTLDNLLATAEAVSADQKTDVIRFYLALSQEATAWRQSFEKQLAGLPTFMANLQQKYDLEAEQLVDKLRAAITDRERAVYGEESTLVVNGTVYVECNTKAGEVRVNGRSQQSLAISDLIAEIEKEATTLRQNATGNEQFIKHLLWSYHALLSARGKSFGMQIETLDLLPLLALQRQSTNFRNNPVSKAFVDYPLAQFRADLHSALASPATVVEGNAFRIASGSNTKGSVFMFVPALERTAHVGRVWFEKVD